MPSADLEKKAGTQASDDTVVHAQSPAALMTAKSRMLREAIGIVLSRTHYASPTITVQVSGRWVRGVADFQHGADTCNLIHCP